MLRTILSVIFSVTSFFLSIASPLSALQPQPASGVRIRYGESVKQVYDMYLPETPAEKPGVVLVIHGGSWLTGDQTRFARYAKQAASLGYVGVTVDYRSLYYKATAADMVDDIAAACESVKAELLARGITPGKLVIAGHSAGAHLGLLYAYGRGAQAPLPIAFVTVVSAPAAPLLTAKGATALEASRYLVATGLTDQNITRETEAEGGAYKAAIDSISPVTLVTPDVPPTIVIHGDADMVVPYENGVLLYETLQKNGVDSLFITNHGMNHFVAQATPEMQQARLDAMLDFAARYL